MHSRARCALVSLLGHASAQSLHTTLYLVGITSILCPHYLVTPCRSLDTSLFSLHVPNPTGVHIHLDILQTALTGEAYFASRFMKRRFP